MKHTIKTAAGWISIEPAGRPGNPFALVTLQKFPFPPINVTLKPEEAQLLSQAFALVAAELEESHAHG